MNARQPTNDGEDETAVLRAKYLDYCSAQLADLLLYLSPDEIFVLAQKISPEDAGRPVPGSYSRIVEVATAWLSERIALPPFEVWALDYTEHPDRYEAYFMGLWESDVRVSQDG